MWDRKSWAGFSPNGLGQTKPNHYWEIAKAVWRNRDELPFAWRILTEGVCDGCALGTAGIHDFTLEGTHLCMVRLELLRLNTMGAMEQGLTIANVLIPARPVERPSRLMGGVFGHALRAVAVILRSYAIYQPIKVFSTLGVVFLIAGIIPIVRFLWYFALDGTAGHIQSLVIGGVLFIVGFQVLVLSLLASALSWNRRMIEELLLRERRRSYGASDPNE